jgi:hypothetical protein
MTPVTFEFLCLVTGRAEVVDNFQDRFRKPFGWDILAVIELEGEQHFESPPFAAHMWSFL